MNYATPAILLISLGLTSCLNAPSKSANPLDALKEFNRPGDTVDCLPINKIKEIKVLDSQHIIFELYGKKTYLNTLPRKCTALAFYDGISYETRLSKLCNVDSLNIHTIRPTAATPTCGLGLFEKLERLEQPENNRP